MRVRPYEPQDFAQIKEWGAEYGANYEESQFPKVGFIVDGIAAYFLYQTDSSCCWLENMVSKKDAEYHVREDALNLLVEAILAEAKRLGFKVAYASTNRFTVALRAKKFGAGVSPNHMHLTLKLEN